MPAADYRKRVTLNYHHGGTQTVYAAVEPLSVQARITTQQLDQPYTHKIRIRYREGIIPSMTVSYRASTFEIIAVIDKEERHVELQLLCVEIMATDPQMSEIALIYPCIDYGRHGPLYGDSSAVRCRLDRDRKIGYFPVGSIKVDDRVECGVDVYIAEEVIADRGVANVAHLEVKLRDGV